MKRIAILTMMLAIAAFAQVPRMLAFQGYAANSDGPMDGSFEVVAKLLKVAEGGQVLWQETHADVAFDNGVYQIVLGSETTLDLDFQSDLYLDITIDGETMTDRVKLTSVPWAMVAQFAMQAGRADSADYADTAGYASHAAIADNATNADTAGYAETVPADLSIDSAYFATGVETDGSVRLTSSEFKQQGVYIRQQLPAGGGRSFEMSMAADGRSRISSVGWGTTNGSGYGLEFTPSGLENLKARDADIDTLIADSAYINGDLEVAENIRATSNEKKDQSIRVQQNYTAGGGRNVAIGLDDDGAYLATSTWGTTNGVGYGLEITPSGLSNVRIKETTTEPTCSSANEGQIIYADDPDVLYSSKTLAVCFRYSNPGGTGYAWKYLTQ